MKPGRRGPRHRPQLGCVHETFAESDQLACIACGQVGLTGPQPRGVPCPGVVAWAMPLVERGPSGRWSAHGRCKGAVASGCGPGAPDHRQTKERKHRRCRYAAIVSIGPSTWPGAANRAFIPDPVEVTGPRQGASSPRPRGHRPTELRGASSLPGPTASPVRGTVTPEPTTDPPKHLNYHAAAPETRGRPRPVVGDRGRSRSWPCARVAPEEAPMSRQALRDELFE